MSDVEGLAEDEQATLLDKWAHPASFSDLQGKPVRDMAETLAENAAARAAAFHDAGGEGAVSGCEFPIPPIGEALTGHWHCPLCPQRVPITTYATRSADGLVFHDSPAPWADVYAHIYAEHPDGMD